jgi:AcrR family transcriptional regulator
MIVTELKKRAVLKASSTSRGAKHEDRKVAILRTAAQLFAQHGYEATSLDMVAEQLGMHKATLYHYIRSKDDVLYACVLKSFEDLDTVIEKMHDRSVPVLYRLREFALRLAHAQNNDFGRCLALVGLRPLQLAPDSDLRKFQRRLDTTVRDLVNEGIASGHIKPCNPGLVSAMLFGTLNWVPQWYRAGGKLSVDDIATAFMGMLVDGIASR